MRPGIRLTGMPQFTDTNVSGPTSIDLNLYFSESDRMFICNYWVGVRTTEAASGYSVDCPCTDQLGSIAQYTGGVGDGSSHSALSGVFICQHGDSAAFTFDIGYFSPFSTLAYDYSIYITPAPGAP